MKMRQRSSRRWTQRDISELRRLAGEQVRITAIARQLGRSIASVEARAAFEGIDLKETGRKLLDQWWPMIQEAKAARVRQSQMHEPVN